jgi:ferric-dicitrate binding protein FerR (iron transport regulator)
MRLFEELTDPKNQAAWMKDKSNFDAAAGLQRVRKKLGIVQPERKLSVRSLWPYVAAASVLILVMLGFLLLKTKEPVVQPPAMAETKQIDLAPGGYRAMLTLSDGRKLALDTMQTGKRILQGASSLKNDSGLLLYTADPRALVSPVDAYNTLAVPAGGQYQLVLPDGTRVWLNSASSLRYPTAFNGAVRRVELTGEGYFEVAKDPMFPFEVVANRNTVRVLGTHFNVNAYSNEPVVKITLAEGAVQVNHHTKLNPGEQAVIHPDGTVQTVAADMETALAWKNGLFVFKHAQMDMIMRQVARWYNCDINYASQVTENFNASIARNTPVSKLLHYLEGTGAVHFTIKDKMITVMK